MRFIIPIATLFFIFQVFISCHKETFTTDPAKLLNLSSDTLSFDTVFTTIGSATRFIKIYNPHDENLIIRRAYLANRNSSHFTMNLDGLSGNDLDQIEIRARDSIYLFCEVKINPNDPLEQSPFVITDSIMLEYNSVKQKLLLIAWGQNANYFPGKLNKGQVSHIDMNGSAIVWNDPKPYIIYGIVYFDNGELIIEEGVRVHVWGGLTKAQDQNGETFFYNDGRLIIGPNASIKVKGTKEKPVVFQGVRLEESFQNTPGQWSGIFIEKQSRNNEFHYAIIKNNLIGIALDSVSECQIRETKIYNNSLYGIYAATADMTMVNCLIYNQGSSGLHINTGGHYEITYCTLVNFGNGDPAIYLSNARCIDFPFCELNYEAELQATIRNTIMTGSDQDELWMSEKQSSAFTVLFQNCLFRVKELPNVFSDFDTRFTQNCIRYASYDRLFKDIFNNDFHPDTLSVIENKAIPHINIFMDLDANIRDMSTPDIGCYEYLIQ